MEKREKQLDELLQKHYQHKKEKQSLGNSFNQRLMLKLQQTEIQPIKPNWIDRTNGYVLVALFLISSVLMTIYFIGTDYMASLSDLNLQLDLQFIQSDGMKYSLYALVSLMFFTFLDRVMQMKNKTSV